MKSLFVLFFLALFSCYTYSQINTFPHNENFENEGLCAASCGSICPLTQSWKNASQVGLAGAGTDWKSDQGGTSSFGTGPDVDHTLGSATGKYVYIESSSPCYPQVTGMIVSPWFDFTNLAVPELNFWYHMLGASMGTMHVDAQVGMNGTIAQDIVPAWTDNDSAWKQRSVLANGFGSTDSVRFIIRGVTGNSFTGDMAVDDIRVGPPPACDVTVIASNVQIGTGLTANHPVSITVQSNGLDTIFAGDTIPVCYQRDVLPAVCEDLVLTADLLPGSSVNYSFSQAANLSGTTFQFRTWTSFPCDQVSNNDTLRINITNNVTPPTCDVSVLSSNVEIGYGLTDTQTVSIVIQTFGSDTLFAGDTIPVCYQVLNQSMVCEDFILPTNLLIGDTITYTFNTLADLSDFQFSFEAWTNLGCDIVAGNDTLSFNALANYPPDFTCTYMWIDLVSTRFRPCRDAFVNLRYENQGIDTAFDVVIKVGMDTNLVVVDSSFDAGWSAVPDSIVGDSACFNIGTVLPQSGGNLYFNIQSVCDTSVVGQVSCLGAHIYPDTHCVAPNQNWDRSSVSVWGQCLNDSLVCFTVNNTGSATNGNMTGPTDWRMYVNNQLVSSGTLQLCGGCDTTLCWPGGGNTIRLEVDQRPGHPGNSNPNASIEMCGNPNQVTGFTNQLPPDDGDHFREIFCREITTAVDPNAKSVIPSGTTADHIVTPNARLEYTIDFQNTGNDTAFTIIITDTLSPNLDLNSITFGAMTHSAVTNQTGNVLTWTFNNVLLPDSTTDEPASHGAVKFTAKPVVGLPNGTVIENEAAIVFDIQAPIITNNAWVTLGDPNTTEVDPTVFGPDMKLKVWPNPSTDVTLFQVAGLKVGTAFEVEVYDLMGNLLRVLDGEGPIPARMERNGLNNGIYVYLVKSQEELLGAGKIILK